MSDDQKQKNNPQDVTNGTPPDDHSQQQAAPASVTITKEGEPIPVTSEKSASPEISYSESEPVIEDKDVKKYMHVTRDEPRIHPDLKKAGLLAIDTSTLDPRHRVELPISDEKIVQGLKQPFTSSWRWLAEFALFMLKQAHLSLKQIHGNVIRVIRR